MNWKNMMNKKRWIFRQGELAESRSCLENPGQRMVWNLYISCSGNHKSGRTEMESERR